MVLTPVLPAPFPSPAGQQLSISASVGKYLLDKVAAKKGSLAEFAVDPSANPISLARRLDDETKKEWRDWLPETLRDFCKLTAKDVQQMDKIMAIQVAVTNVDVFSDWQLFLSCCIAFTNRRVNFDWLDKPSYLECAWACTVLRVLRPNTDFGPGVIRFLNCIMLEDGLVYFPWTGGEGIALDDGETGKYVRGLHDCQALARDMKKIKVESLNDIELPEDGQTDEKDPHQVQLLKLICGAAFILANESRGK